VTATIKIDGGPRGVAVSHDGAHLYVTRFLAGTVDVIGL
jgi:DNA-binding beta-propeller fold protein YncE